MTKFELYLLVRFQREIIKSMSMTEIHPRNKRCQSKCRQKLVISYAYAAYLTVVEC